MNHQRQQRRNDASDQSPVGDIVVTGNKATATMGPAQMAQMAQMLTGVTTLAINNVQRDYKSTTTTNTNCNNTAAPAAGGNLTKDDVAELLEEQNQTLHERQQKLANEAVRKAVKAIQEECQQQQARNKKIESFMCANGTTLQIDETLLYRLCDSRSDQEGGSFEIAELHEAIDKRCVLPAAVVAQAGTLGMDVDQFMSGVINFTRDQVKSDDDGDGKPQLYCGQGILVFPGSTCFLSCSFNGKEDGHTVDEEWDFPGTLALGNNFFYELLILLGDRRDFAFVLAAKDSVYLMSALGLVLGAIKEQTDLKELLIANTMPDTENMLLFRETHKRLLGQASGTLVLQSVRRSVTDQLLESNTTVKLIYDACDLEAGGQSLFEINTDPESVVVPTLNVHFKKCCTMKCQVLLESVVKAAEDGLLKHITFEDRDFVLADVRTSSSSAWSFRIDAGFWQ